MFYLLSLLFLLVGLGAGYYLRFFLGRKTLASAEQEALNVLDQAKSESQKILRQANEKSVQLLEESKKEEAHRRAELQRLQERLEKRESAFDQQLTELESERKKLRAESDKLVLEKEKVEQLRAERETLLQKTAGLSVEEAKKALFQEVENRINQDLSIRLKKLELESNVELEKRSRTLLATAMQRYSGTHVTETTTTTVILPSEDMKGRIIGKEGRNIKALEMQTGVEFIIDDTPNTILISGFNPLRRHIAKKALERLILDGRIQPAKIEEAIDMAKSEIADDIRQAGEEALQEVGVIGIDPKLVQILGRLKYRTSYGQNVLRHSIEVAIISGLLAEELGANISLCKKGGILHDIGKAVDHEVQGTHPEIGYEIMRKFGLPEEVAYLSIAHHETNPKTLEGVICLIADRVSGGRPGARRDSLEEYITRLSDLEAIATRNPGVERAFAISAGRELRVIIRSNEMNDWEAAKLARKIADDIEQEMKFPGEIKINVIREKRVIEYAR